MNFSTFAKIIYKHMPNSGNKYEFVILLTNSIIRDEVEEYNPLSEKETNTIGKIFSGNLDLGKKSATMILDNLDSKKFESFLLNKLGDVKESVIENFKKEGVNLDNNLWSIGCTKLFINILTACKGKKNNTKNKTAKDIKHKLIEQNMSSNLPCGTNKEILDYFSDAVNLYGIVEFIGNVDPTVYVDEDRLLIDCNCFVECINSGKWIPYKPISCIDTSKTIEKIRNFTFLLDEYVDYLLNNMCEESNDKNCSRLVPLYREKRIDWEIKFGNTVLNFRMQLRDKYRNLMEEFDTAVKSDKVAIDKIKVMIKNLKYSQKTKEKFIKILEEMEFDKVFGRKLVPEITKDSETASGNLIKKLIQSHLIIEVTGQGKGKYHFLREPQMVSK